LDFGASESRFGRAKRARNMKFTSIFFTASAEDLRALAQSITNLRVSEQNQNLFGFWSERKQIRQSQTSESCTSEWEKIYFLTQ
jgi:hypothetical protein